MKIALLNGSPKVNHSASSVLLEDLKARISTKAEIIEISLHKPDISEKISEELKSIDSLVFSCPLYVDGIPSHLLSCLIQLEKAHWQNREMHVYGIINCGFYEGIQTEPALKLLENWCIKAGLTWGGGIGIGGGGALEQLPNMEKGPKAPIYQALGILADNILQQEVRDNHYVSIAFPRFLYKLAAQLGWRQMIKANGQKARDLGHRPE